MIVLSFFLLLLTCGASKEELRHVHVLFRHGDRSPERIFSTGITGEDKWPNGLGQLTEIGMVEQFRLGKWLRRRYNKLMRNKYFHKEIQVRSTDYDRTLMSAQLCLAGLYYILKDPIIENLGWRPIPVHTVPKASDTIMLPFRCKQFQEKLQEMYRSEYYRSLFSDFQKTLDLIRKEPGYNYLKPEDIYHVYDILFCEKKHNMPFVSWVTDQVYLNISKMYSINWKMMFYNDELARLSGGGLLNKIVSRMIEIATGDTLGLEKMMMYSGHDINIASLLSAIGIYDGVHPPYTACLLIELVKTTIPRSDPLQNWVVKIYYKINSSDSEIDLPEIRIKRCQSQPCTLRHFLNFVEPRRLSEDKYKKNCDLNSSSGKETLSLLILLMLSKAQCILGL